MRALDRERRLFFFFFSFLPLFLFVVGLDEGFDSVQGGFLKLLAMDGLINLRGFATKREMLLLFFSGSAGSGTGVGLGGWLCTYSVMIMGLSWCWGCVKTLFRERWEVPASRCFVLHRDK